MFKKSIFLIFFISINSYSQIKVKSPVEIPFVLSDDGHIVIQAVLNGVKGNFIFDTGAGLNLITEKFANKIKDLNKTHHFYTGYRATGEQLQGNLWVSKTLALDSYIIENEIFAVYDLNIPIDGLISLTPFKKNAVTINFDDKILIIESKKSLKRLNRTNHFKIPIQVLNDRDIAISIFIAIQLENNLKLNVNLDSGAGFNVFKFHSKYMKDLNINSENIKSEYKNSLFLPSYGNNYFYTSLKKMCSQNNNNCINNLNVIFIDGLIYEGIMSLNWIGKSITIDIVNKELLVEQ